MEAKKKKDVILYIVITTLIIGIIVMGILMIKNKKDNSSKSTNPSGIQGGMELQDGSLEGIKIPEIDIPDDGKGVQIY